MKHRPMSEIEKARRRKLAQQRKLAKRMQLRFPDWFFEGLSEKGKK